jgi:hypothetical protein
MVPWKNPYFRYFGTANVNSVHISFFSPNILYLVSSSRNSGCYWIDQYLFLTRFKVRSGPYFHFVLHLKVVLYIDWRYRFQLTVNIGELSPRVWLRPSTINSMAGLGPKSPCSTLFLLLYITNQTSCFYTQHIFYCKMNCRKFLTYVFHFIFLGDEKFVADSARHDVAYRFRRLARG